MLQTFYKQRGSAIIVALFVVSLVSAAAAAMMFYLHMDTQRLGLILTSNQAELYAQGSVDWAKDILAQNLKNKKANQLTDRLPFIRKEEINGYTIVTTIEDSQAKFNINNLITAEYAPNLIRLIHVIDPQLDLDKINTLVHATQNWLIPISNDELDVFYGKQHPPYHASHRLMVSVSELRLVKGMDAALFAKLAPYLTTLPITTTINVNSASLPVLVSLSPSITPQGALSIINHIQQSPFLNVNSFAQFDIVKNNNFEQQKITTDSNYFLVTSNVTVGHQQIILYTLLSRMMKDSKPLLTTLWQSQGTL